MPKRKVSDDEVLQVMSDLGLDAEDLIVFRTTRHLLTHGVPPCCITFMEHYVQAVPRFPSEMLDGMLDDEGLLGDVANTVLAHLKYFAWASERAKKAGFKKLYYTPCPACALAGKFVKLPKGCACCHDQQEHPGPEEGEGEAP